MKKIVIMAAVAASAVFAQANVVLNMGEGYLYKHNGSTILPENSTVVLLCDANGDGSLDNLSSLTNATTAWTVDPNDVVLGRWAFNYNLDTGLGSDAITFDYTGAVSTGDKMAFVWYDKSYSAGDAGPGQGIYFGAFSTAGAISGSDLGWSVPSDGTYTLNFATQNAGGDSLESAGVASLQTIPEPASAVLALLGAGLVYVVRRNTRRAIYQG